MTGEVPQYLINYLVGARSNLRLSGTLSKGSPYHSVGGVTIYTHNQGRLRECLEPLRKGGSVPVIENPNGLNAVDVQAGQLAISSLSKYGALLTCTFLNCSAIACKLKEAKGAEGTYFALGHIVSGVENALEDFGNIIRGRFRIVDVAFRSEESIRPQIENKIKDLYKRGLTRSSQVEPDKVRIRTDRSWDAMMVTKEGVSFLREDAPQEWNPRIEQQAAWKT